MSSTQAPAGRPAAGTGAGNGRVLSVRRAGNRAVLAEMGSLDNVLALQAMLLESPIQGQVELLAAAETLMVTAESASAADRIGRTLRTLELARSRPTGGELVTIDTTYDGEDLAEVARLTGLSTEGVVAFHTGQTWNVAFTGFAPGFGYMVGEDARNPAIPRRTSPRTAVPAGSVALAGQYTAVYPRQSPGGWQLIGHTGATMWDLGRDNPALVRPGNRVRFHAVREVIRATAAPSPRAGHGQVESGLEVLRSVPLTLIQDLGRTGYLSLGVSASGALDQGSVRRANRIAGNPPGDAVLEIMDGGLTVKALGEQVIAVTGAPVRLLVESSGGRREEAMATPFALRDGEILTLGIPATGVRSYLAVRGGLDVPEVLGSRSTDTLSGVGPSPVLRGDILATGPSLAGRVVGEPEQQPDFPGKGVTVLEITRGPRADWFDESAIEQLCEQDWTVSNDSNRIGMRLQGNPLMRRKNGELPSEGTVAGALQVPPSGLPVLFLADHPVTGGYPVIAVLEESQLDKAAQVPAGGSIRFRLHSPTDERPRTGERPPTDEKADN